ncbi:hypothetical protein HFO24_04985 [Rhizobium laguerreae]|uniref:esterase/lipase family protein n=1 Tax=Rhizobium laguerreae TaxID=1076926 RepID=UPI001C924236|nr:hypothetical protein [Rhizobium laguerreae]MBY3181026.1 hypothetical protein [Rhizobium laguerreae]
MLSLTRWIAVFVSSAALIIRRWIVCITCKSSVKTLLLALPILLLNAVFAGAEEYDAIKITAVNTPCEIPSADLPVPKRSCTGRDAVFFVHGIYGDKDTFKNGNFDWPSTLAKALDDEVDVYVIEYHTKLLSWLKRDIASFDDVSDALFAKLQGKPRPGSGNIRDGLLSFRPYRSVGFIAHSLGGNVTAAYIHTVKSELGHEERAQNGFLITLGTPANGAQIANVAVAIKSMLGIEDPLLKSLERDNTFVRMLASWRNAEDRKATRFYCRPVDLYVGVEGAPMHGMTIVSKESAEEPYKALAREVKFFEGYDHSRIAKPIDANDPVYVWVLDTIKNERKRLDHWDQPKLCRRSC